MQDEILIYGVVDMETGQFVRFGAKKAIEMFAIQEVYETEEEIDQLDILIDFHSFGLVVDYLEYKGYRIEVLCTVTRRDFT